MQLVIHELSKRYKDKIVLDRVDYTFEKGKIYGLLGRNGAGKTTLFNCLAKYLDYESGVVELIREQPETALYNSNNTEVLIDSNNINTTASPDNHPSLDDVSKTSQISQHQQFKNSKNSHNQYSESDIGFVFTQPHLPEFLTGREFIKFFIDINKGKIDHPLSIDEYFRLVAFEPVDGDRLIKSYSHGMMNKLQMLISLFILRPPVILLDEPLTSFDVVAALEVKNMIKKIKDDHIIIFSTHILELAQDLCDEIVVLHNGALQHIPSENIHSPQFESDIIKIMQQKNENDDVALSQEVINPTKSPSAEPTTPSSAEPTKSPSAEPTTPSSAESTKSPSAEPTTPPSAESSTPSSAEPTKSPSADPGAPPSPKTNPDQYQSDTSDAVQSKKGGDC